MPGMPPLNPPPRIPGRNPPLIPGPRTGVPDRNGPHLPPWVPIVQDSQPGRGNINSTAQTPSRRYASVAAEGTILPIIYGTDFIGPIISLVQVYGDQLVLRCLWCLGEIEAVESVKLQDGGSTDQMTMTHYTGRNDQPVDPFLAIAVPGYNDRCIVDINGESFGVAYSVIRIPRNTTQGFPRLIAKVRGRKVRDPRGGPFISFASTDFTSPTFPRIKLGYQGTAHKYTASPNTRGTAASSLVADGSQGTVTLVIRQSGTTGITKRIFECGGGKFTVSIGTDNKVSVVGRNAANTIVLNLRAATVVDGTSSAGLAMVFSWNLTTSAARIYTNGVSDSDLLSVTGGATINYAATGYALGGEYATTNNPLDGHLAGFSFDNQYRDLAAAGVAAQFFDIQGRLKTLSYTPTFSAPIGHNAALTYTNTPAILSDDCNAIYNAISSMNRNQYVYAGLDGGLFYFRNASGSNIFMTTGLGAVMAQLPSRIYAKIDFISGAGNMLVGHDNAEALLTLNSANPEQVVEWTAAPGGSSMDIQSDGVISCVIRKINAFPSPHSYSTSFTDFDVDLTLGGAGWDTLNGFMFQKDALLGGAYTPIGDTLYSEVPLWFQNEEVEWAVEVGDLSGGSINMIFDGLVQSFVTNGLYTGRTNAGTSSGPSFEITGEGSILNFKCSTRTLYQIFTKTPSLMLADLLESPVYGLGGDVNDEYLLKACAYNEEILTTKTATEMRHQAGISMTNQQGIMQWIETFRAYARCFITQRDGEYLLIPDKPGDSVAYVTPTNMVRGSFRVNKKSLLNQPNVVKVFYTSTVAEPWTEDSVEAVKSTVVSGDEFRRETALRLPGIQSRSMAMRFAIERLNMATLIDLEGSFTSFDLQWPLEVADIIELDHPVGLSGKLVRVMRADVADRGKISVSFTEYDVNAYSNEIVDEPPPPDTTGPTPFKVPQVTGLALVESFYSSGMLTSSQLKITWTSVNYAFLQYYLVEIYENGTKIHTARVPDTIYFFRGLELGSSYNVQVRAVSTAFVNGLPATATLLAQGSNLPPDFSNGQIVAFEAGDAINAYVREPALDIDLWGYEWRYREAVANNLWPKGGVNLNVADWSGSTGFFTFSTRKLAFTSGGGSISINATAAGGTLVNGQKYDVYIKVRKFKVSGTAGLCIAPFGSSPIIGGDGTNLWMSNDNDNNRPGLYILRDFQVDTSQDFYIAKYNGSGAVSSFELEYIAFREPASNCANDWASAAFFERSPQTNIRINQVAGGAYVLYCKALDSQRTLANPYGQYSAVTQQASVNVVSDSAAFLRLEYIPAWSSGNTIRYGKANQPTLWDYSFEDSNAAQEITGYMVPVDTGRTWNTAFAGTVNSYGSPVFNNFENSGGSHIFVHDTIDIGTIVNGRLTYILEYETYSTSAPTWVLYYWNNPGDTPTTKVVKSVEVPIDFNGRYFYLEATVAAGGKSVFTRNQKQTVEITAFPRQETGTAVTLGPDGSGNAQPVTVTLQNSYVSALNVRAWAATTTTLNVYVDNITLGAVTTFTVVALNLRGEPTAANINWEFRGV